MEAPRSTSAPARPLRQLQFPQEINRFADGSWLPVSNQLVERLLVTIDPNPFSPASRLDIDNFNQGIVNCAKRMPECRELKLVFRGDRTIPHLSWFLDALGRFFATATGVEIIELVAAQQAVVHGPFLDGLFASSKLHTLIAPRCNVSEAFCNALVTAISRPVNPVQLARLNLSGNDLKFSPQLSTVFSFRYLRTLTLADNNIRLRDIKRISDLLATNNTVEVLVLNGNKFGKEGVALLSKALVSNTTLHSLAIGVPMEDAGATALADLLRVNKTLQCLAIPTNSIGRAGFQVLCKAMETNQGLCRLDLSQTVPHVEGLNALSALLEVNPRIAHLVLDGVTFAPAAANRFAAALRVSTTLRSLSLLRSKMVPDTAAALIPALATHPTLRTLGLPLGGLSVAVQKQMLAALAAQPLTLTELEFSDSGQLTNEVRTALRPIQAQVTAYAEQLRTSEVAAMDQSDLRVLPRDITNLIKLLIVNP